MDINDAWLHLVYHVITWNLKCDFQSETVWLTWPERDVPFDGSWREKITDETEKRIADRNARDFFSSHRLYADYQYIYQWRRYLVEWFHPTDGQPYTTNYTQVHVTMCWIPYTTPTTHQYISRGRPLSIIHFGSTPYCHWLHPTLPMTQLQASNGSTQHFQWNVRQRKNVDIELKLTRTASTYDMI